MVVGLCLAGVGGLWILANFGKVDFLSAMRMWWPASFIVWGVLELVMALTGSPKENLSAPKENP
jgi:hypothetical protein